MKHLQKYNIVGRILIINCLIAAVVTFILFISGSTDSALSSLYGVLFLGFIPVLGGISGLTIAKNWGSFKSSMGRAIIFLSLGLISWGLGTYIFSGIYNFILKVPVPYPSIADVGYILALPLWAIGIFNLSRVTGAKYGLRSSSGKALLLFIPTIVVIISYYLLVVVVRGGIIDLSQSALLELFFDLAYPIGDIVILTLATLIYGLSYNYLGGIYKKAIYAILLGFIVLYFADFAFSYSTTLDTFYSGNWIDLLFTIAMLLLSLGVNKFDREYSNSIEA